MNVYINKSQIIYGAGLIIVAANDINEAHQLMINYNSYLDWSDIYNYNDWELIEDLIYNGDKPKVISETHYEE